MLEKKGGGAGKTQCMAPFIAYPLPPLSNLTMLGDLATERAESPLSSMAVTSAPLEMRYLAASLCPPRALGQGMGGGEGRKGGMRGGRGEEKRGGGGEGRKPIKLAH